jgi:hypothetical protein
MSPHVIENDPKPPLEGNELRAYFDEPAESAWYSAVPALIGGLLAGLAVPTLIAGVMNHIWI